MFEILESHLDQILKKYSQGEYYDEVVAAKKKYFELTGLTNEEDDDYETRMRSFNDWFILHYPIEDSFTPLELYLKSEEVEETAREILRKFRYSVFEFNGKSLGGKMVVKDLLSNEKLNFTENSSTIPVFKGDVFIGRILKVEDDFMLLGGMCLLPKEAKSIIKKQIKKVRKNSEAVSEQDFLLELENLKTKWQRFGHVDASKIFVFQS